MAKSAAELSVAALERMLETKKSKLEKFTKQRDQLQRKLETVEKKIAELSGPAGRGPGKRVSRKRPKNVKSLKAFVREILGRSKKGLTLSALGEKVLAAGYKSKSKRFTNVLYQCLYGNDEFVHDEKTKTYRLEDS